MIALSVFAGVLSGILLLIRFPSLKKSSTIDPGNYSVIIPARNEEKNIRRLLESLHRQSVLPGEIIVVDDNSADDTAEVSESLGAEVLSLKEKAAGWTGKTYALQKGAERAKGEYLLFLDADLIVERNFIELLVSKNISRKTVLSIQPFHKVKRFHEQFSLLFNFLILMGVGAFTVFGRKLLPSGSFGPCLLIRREDYFALGGHKMVKGKVLEHFNLGSILHEKGFQQELYSGKGLVSFRMYPEGFGDLWEGWTKGFSNGASGTKACFMIPSVLWITSLLLLPLPFLVSVSLPFFILHSVSTVLLILHMVFALTHVGSFSPVNILILPIHALFFLSLFFVSVIKVKLLKKVTWRGREVEL